MQQSVKNKRKKRFLTWMKQYFQIEEEFDWFLQDLIDDNQLISKLHFVQDIEHCPKGIIISNSGVEGLSFLFFKGGVYTDDVYTAYHELQLYREEAFYMKVNLPELLQNSLYYTLLEDEQLAKTSDATNAKELLSHLLFQGKVERLENAINRALDNRDDTQFKELSTKLKKLKSKKETIT